MTKQGLLPVALGFAFLVLPACSVDTNGLCDDLCDELVDKCGFEAFPEDQPRSCYDGCVYDDVERNAAVAPLTECVLAADCDPFVVLQCARAYGGSDDRQAEAGGDDG